MKLTRRWFTRRAALAPLAAPAVIAAAKAETLRDPEPVIEPLEAVDATIGPTVPYSAWACTVSCSTRLITVPRLRTGK